MASFRPNYIAQTGNEGITARSNDALGEALPFQMKSLLQGLETGVSDSGNFGFQNTPDGEVKGVQVWGVWRPFRGGDEAGSVILKPLLGVAGLV